MQVTKDSTQISAAIISVPEAIALSNLSQETLMALVKDGTIKGRKIGTAMKIYRMSLASYLAKSQKAESAPERMGASAASEASVDATDLRDEVWALKKALAESQQAIEAKQALITNEQHAHMRTKQQLVDSEKKLNEALTQIEHMMMHQEASMRPQSMDLPSTQASGYMEAMVEPRPSFFQRVLGWLGLR